MACYVAVFKDGPMGDGSEDRHIVSPVAPPNDQWYAPAPARAAIMDPHAGLHRDGDACAECGWSGGHACTCSEVAHLPRPDLRWMLVGNSHIGAPPDPWPGQVHYELLATEGDHAYYAAAAA